MPEARPKRNPIGASAQRGRISAERWRAILDAAAEIFAAKGYEATTIRDIAEAVGMLAGSLYYYIDTKEDLLFALIEDFHQVGSAGIAEVEASTEGDSISILRAVLVSHVELNARNVARTAVFHNDFRHLDPDRKREIVQSRRSHENRIEELIRKAHVEGTVRSTIDPRLTALSILSMLNSTHEWYRPSKSVSPVELGHMQADLILNGLAAAATTKRPARAQKQRPARAEGNKR
jgi:AcrR family transcriptional regulator